jgi:PEP-CTERM motif-containing protein
VSSFIGSLVLDTALEIKFFGIIADPNDPAANFDSIVLTTLLGPNQPSGFIMDNVAFVPVPEPASLTLFGLGIAGLAARWRRKR